MGTTQAILILVSLKPTNPASPLRGGPISRMSDRSFGCLSPFGLSCASVRLHHPEPHAKATVYGQSNPNTRAQKKREGSGLDPPSCSTERAVRDLLAALLPAIAISGLLGIVRASRGLLGRLGSRRNGGANRAWRMFLEAHCGFSKGKFLAPTTSILTWLWFAIVV